MKRGAYERGSIIVTSDRGFEAWGEILSDAMVAAALIDRLVHHAHIVTLKGKSYRLRERGSAQAPNRRVTPQTELWAITDRSFAGYAGSGSLSDGALFKSRKRCTFQFPLTACPSVRLCVAVDDIGNIATSRHPYGYMVDPPSRKDQPHPLPVLRGGVRFD